MKKLSIVLLLFIVATTFATAYSIVSTYDSDKEVYIKDKADELGITEGEYLESLIEQEYLADNPELPVVSEEEELTGKAISLIYEMREDKSKLQKAITELKKIKSSSVIGEISK